MPVSQPLDKSESLDQQVSASIAFPVVAVLIGICVLMALFMTVLNHHNSRETEPPNMLDQLNQRIPASTLSRWRGAINKQCPQVPDMMKEEMMCVICLEVIKDDEFIRALSCHHLYHVQCFDRWFREQHRYCPLCHRIILPAESERNSGQV